MKDNQKYKVGFKPLEICPASNGIWVRITGDSSSGVTGSDVFVFNDINDFSEWLIDRVLERD